MNYGYAPTPYDAQLWQAIAQYVATEVGEDVHGMKCYVEKDALYYGVRIRRITHYTEEQQQAIVDGADKVYAQVMERYGMNDETPGSKYSQWKEFFMERWNKTRPFTARHMEATRRVWKRQNETKA